MAGREGKTRLRRRMSGSTRVVQRPVQLFSASSATSWASRWLESWSSVKAQKTLPRRFVKFHCITRLSVTMWFARGHRWLASGSSSRCSPCHSASRRLFSSSTAYQHWSRPWRGEFWAFLAWGSTTTSSIPSCLLPCQVHVTPSRISSHGSASSRTRRKLRTRRLW